MVGQICLWMALLLLFGATVTFIRLVSLFVADVASSLEALVLKFLVLTFVPRVVFFCFKPLKADAFSFESSITLALAS